MNRTEMIDKAARELVRNVEGFGHVVIEDCDIAARIVVDTILPQVSTVAELEALLLAVGEAGEPAVVVDHGRPFILTEDERGEWWAHSYQREDEPSTWRRVDDLTLPLTVVWQP